jgi:hypothetical protein
MQSRSRWIHPKLPWKYSTYPKCNPDHGGYIPNCLKISNLPEMQPGSRLTHSQNVWKYPTYPKCNLDHCGHIPKMSENIQPTRNAIRITVDTFPNCLKISNLPENAIRITEDTFPNCLKVRHRFKFYADWVKLTVYWIQIIKVKILLNDKIMFQSEGLYWHSPAYRLFMIIFEVFDIILGLYDWTLTEAALVNQPIAKTFFTMKNISLKVCVLSINKILSIRLSNSLWASFCGKIKIHLRVSVTQNVSFAHSTPFLMWKYMCFKSCLRSLKRYCTTKTNMGRLKWYQSTASDLPISCLVFFFNLKGLGPLKNF